MEPALEHLVATLEPHPARGRCRVTGAEVRRTKADVDDPELLLEQVRRDFREKTATEFAAK